MNIAIAILPIILLFVLSYILILLAVQKELSSDLLYDNNLNNFPNISIIVAAKNEAYNIPVLISALKKINYPLENYEVIIVDDDSTDNTFEIAKEQCAEMSNFLIAKADDKNYSGKRGALDYGISLARSSNILITDADCIPEENWLNACSKKITDCCNFYFGIAPFIQRNNLINKMICYENFVNSFIAISALKLKIPYTASARNLGFKKEAYEKVGCYGNTTDTISGDDDLLLREVLKNKVKICAVTNPDSFVYSETKKTFKDYVSQRARHTQSSFYYPLKQKLFLTLWHLLNIAFILSPLFVFANILFVLPFIIKIIFDMARALLYQKKFGYRFNVIEVFYLQILYEIFLIVHLINAKFREVKWK